MNHEKPIHLINAAAPIRICDNGGWTDTWFAEYGKIFNIAVYPYAEVQIAVYPRQNRERVTIFAENYGERYSPQPQPDSLWDRHPLLEAAIERMGIPEEIAVQVTIFCEAPAGASTGTSAAVTVALIGALDCLTPGRLTPHEVAYTAQAIETDMLKQQCGIQDQLCSAYGGLNYIEMFRYPHASVSPILIPNETWWELERRLVLIFLGKSHSSSQVHQQVIRGLENSGPNAPQLQALRQTAEPSRNALYTADFAALGQAMIANTEAQRALHPALIGPEAQQIINLAQAHRALGWKVNGAGGDGGSITLLCDNSSSAKRILIREIEQENSLFKHIPTYLSRHGLRVWSYR